MRKHHFYLIVACLLLFVVQASFEIVKTTNEKIVGKVVSITDGDTFKLLTQDSTQIKVRVANIDCPERKQPFYQKAKQFTSEAVFNKKVTIEVLKKDRYKRYVAQVYYNDSLELGEELIKHGLAWHFKKYSNDTTLQSMENLARNNKMGLWQDPNPIAPWEWRASKKKPTNKQ